ncbi:class I SAM-dependent methyltransferase [Rhodospirillales bacterium]|nr:class I SAM-dependent methyltransferase [Rhodospirillales bacterium]
MSSEQQKSTEWSDQWEMFQDDHHFLFLDWIKPLSLDVFKGKRVLECGCGGGHHTRIMASKATHVTAVDLNTVQIAKERCADLTNISFVEADLATMDLKDQFDIVVCIGVIHHTDDPDRVFDRLYEHLVPGGKLIIWAYSAEGNFLVQYIVEPVRKIFLSKVSRRFLSWISRLVTMLLYPLVYTIYTFPFFQRLPYWKYFGNFRKLSFERNVLNVFDKLNAPQTKFTTFSKCKQWMSEKLFLPESITINSYVDVSWTLTGTKKED